MGSPGEEIGINIFDNLFPSVATISSSVAVMLKYKPFSAKRVFSFAVANIVFLIPDRNCAEGSGIEFDVSMKGRNGKL